jgi:hypothetical protein
MNAGQLERLDYLVAQLKNNGIYTDIVLHACRYYPAFTRWEGMPPYFKGVDNFFPGMVTSQKEFARSFIAHVNPYTHVAYKDEPALALLEINNEGGLLQVWWQGNLESMPDPYAAELQRQWNAWLKTRYTDTDALASAWTPGRRSDVVEMLAGDAWHLEQYEPAHASLSTAKDGPDGHSAFKVDVQQHSTIGWHVQLNQAQLPLIGASPYMLSFWGKGQPPRRVTVAITQTHQPWRSLWRSEVELTNRWKRFEFAFTTTESDGNTRLTFTDLANQVGAVWISEPSLHQTPQTGLTPGTALGAQPLFSRSTFGAHTVRAQDDWVRFLWETELLYWQRLSSVIKKEVGAHALVIGTQTAYSPALIQATMDVVDGHAYWQHPHFPHRMWDTVDWWIANAPMAGTADGGTIPRLGLSRVIGKPFVCTEYNHPAPNTFSSEAVPLISAYGALQDWDGIFVYDYSSRLGEWNVGRIPNFFDIDQHPAKMATLPASVALFVRGDVKPPDRMTAAPVTLEDALAKVRTDGPDLSAAMFGVDPKVVLRMPAGLSMNESEPMRPPDRFGDSDLVGSDDGQVLWDARAGRQSVIVNTPLSRAVIGYLTDRPVDLGDAVITPGRTIQHWAAITATVISGSGFHPPSRLVVTATGYAENARMEWKDAQQSSVGEAWGQPPSKVEGIPFSLLLSVPPRNARAWALDERGQHATSIHVADSEGRALVTFGPQYKTLWYEVELD